MMTHENKDRDPIEWAEEKSFGEVFEETDNESDYTSFACGIAAGMKMMTLNTNED